VGISGPGASARREYEQPIGTWEQGASGERIVGARLDRIAGIEVLHDRLISGRRSNINHIAVGPGGVYVIDAKLYTGRVEQRDVGRFLRTDVRLFVGGRDQSKRVAKLTHQVNAISRALGDTPVPVVPALCVVEAQGATFGRPFMLDGVWVGTPDGLPDLVARPGLLDAEAILTTARRLDQRLPRA
jgi:hypothetical protein